MCSSLTDLDQTFADLETLKTLQRPEVEGNLLAALVEVLGVLQGRAAGYHIPAAANLAEALFDAGGLEPAEEAIPRPRGGRGDERRAHAAPGAGPPRGPRDLPPGTSRRPISPTSWRWSVGPSLAVDPESGLTGLQRLRRRSSPRVLGEDDTWRLVGNAGRLLADERSRASDALELLPELLALNPDLALLRQLGPLLFADEQLSGPLLRVLERREVVDATAVRVLAGARGPGRLLGSTRGQRRARGPAVARRPAARHPRALIGRPSA